MIFITHPELLLEYDEYLIQVSGGVAWGRGGGKDLLSWEVSDDVVVTVQASCP